MIPFSQDFVNRCKKGDPAAQKELFSKLYAPLYRLCYRYTGCQATAEDCMMKAFMKCFQKIEGFEWQGEHSMFVWVRKIMVNESLMELRNASPLTVAETDSMANQPSEENVIDQLSAEELFSLITQLPTGFRTVFNLFVIEGYTHNEIAALLNITESTSRTQLQKARKRLQQMIEKQNQVYGNYAG